MSYNPQNPYTIENHAEYNELSIVENKTSVHISYSQPDLYTHTSSKLYMFISEQCCPRYQEGSPSMAKHALGYNLDL